MMSTFRDILSDFELASAIPGVGLAELVVENDDVEEKPDVIDDVDGLSRWCSGCEEYWPLEKSFFGRSYHGVSGFSSRCKACVKEAEAKYAARQRIPANVAGPLTVYFPEDPSKTCRHCHGVYPYLALFWRRDETGALTDVCVSCKPKTS